MSSKTATTLTVPLYGLDASQSIAASVISAAPNATTFYLECIESPSDPNACIGFAYSRTLITGPSTYLLDISEPGLSSTQDCTTSLSYAVCDEFASASNLYLVGQGVYPLESVTSFTVPVTDGLEKLVEAEATGMDESGSGSATARRTGGTLAMNTQAATTTSAEKSATVTGEAASGSSTGAAAARGLGREVGIMAAICGVVALWL